MQINKVFGIGLSKTGTHSLNAALTELGYPSVHYPCPALMSSGRYAEALGAHRAATDITVSAYFRELDAAYPGSRFILTTRDTASWLNSVQRHYARREHELDEPDLPKHKVREAVYGIRDFDPVVFASAYAAHTDAVREYFRDRPDDLLEMSICGGEGWDRLCPFLGVEGRVEHMPWENRTIAS